MKRAAAAVYRALLRLDLPAGARRAFRRTRARVAETAHRSSRPDVRVAGSGSSPVDRYWSRHLVREEPFVSAAESEEYLEWRFAEYPMYRQLMELWGWHDGEVVLDYGCGPGNDTVGFLLYTRASRVIGVDVSAAALELARKRIALHRVDRSRVELIRVADDHVALPLAAGSVDFVHCSGVLHHVSAPDATLRELHRVLRPEGRGGVMVYNRESVWFHLYVAYVLMVLGHDMSPIDDVFRRSTDGPECPVSIAYAPSRFTSLLEAAGFDAEFVGGYLSRHELEILERYGEAARADRRLPDPHRRFLDGLAVGPDGLPRSGGQLAGIGGVYRLRRR